MTKGFVVLTIAKGREQESQRRSLSIQKWALWTAAGLIAFLLISSLWIGYRRLGWYDEVVVLTIARLPTTNSVFKAIGASASSLPPFYFLLVRFFDHLFGSTDGAARIPSALAMAAGMVVTFDCARRATNNLHALAAVALLTCSCLPYYGYEARPYALCFLLSAIGFWLATHPHGDRKPPAVLFGLTFFAAFCFHYYTALCLVPYAVLEASAWRPFRRPSAKLIAGVAGIFCGVAACAPFMMAARRFSHGFWSPASLTGFQNVFTEVFPSALLAGAVVVAGLALLPGRGEIKLVPMLPIERLGWLFLLIPIAGFGLAVTVTNAFVSRYFIIVLPGVAVAFACTLWRRFEGRPTISAAIVAVMLILGAGPQARLTARPDLVRPPLSPEASEILKVMLALESKLLAEGKTAIVLSASETLAMESPYYSRNAKAYVLLNGETTMLSRAHQDIARFCPMTFWSVADVRANASRVALINPPDVVLAELMKAGFRLEFVETPSWRLKAFYLSN
jgi:uncharacterized membrane protein